MTGVSLFVTILAGALNVFVGVLVGLLVSKMGKFEAKLDHMVFESQCHERQDAVKRDVNILWEEFKKHKHSGNGELLR